MTAASESHRMEWSTVPLGEIAEIKLGKMLDRTKHTTGRKLPYLRNINVRWGSIEVDDLAEMYFENDQIERFGLKDNDVLVCEGGEPGRAAVWRGGVTDLKFQKALHRVRFKVPFEPMLLVYLLESLTKGGGLERRFTGSTIKHFTREAFLQLPVPLLPKPEQQRIVAEIEKEFTRLEAGVTSLKRVEANAKNLRRRFLHDAFSSPRLGSESRARLRLGDIARTSSGGTPSRDRPEYYGGLIPWVKSGELNDGVIHESEETLSAADTPRLRHGLSTPLDRSRDRRGTTALQDWRRRAPNYFRREPFALLCMVQR